MTFDSRCYDLASEFLEDEPNLFTDSACMLLAARIQQAVAEGIRRDGSSTGALYSPELTVAVSDAGVVLTLTQPYPAGTAPHVACLAAA